MKIRAERLEVGDEITALAGDGGEMARLPWPRVVTAISPEFPDAKRTLAVASTRRAGRWPGMRVFDREEWVEVNR